MSATIKAAKRTLLLATSIFALSPSIAFAQTPAALPPVEISPPTDQNKTRARPLDDEGRGATRPQRTARPSRGAGTGSTDGASTGTGTGGGTGSGGRQFNGIVGASSSVITAEEIAHSPSNNLPDILAQVPGVQLTTLFGFPVNGA
jgi:iron complex outermembrane receptor protein